ncbi:MAG TPA: heterodisulfide reductase-related iron-sulfur binding cluster [Acidimicrobiales bacterium]|nr:heterodisulfide reductase-related iron-sulfur binding cluster [Acidimicrobiales bacterium]
MTIEQSLVDDCVHCGFCLPACPTYALWGEEMDSPRGRVYLMGEYLGGETMSGSMVEHFDRCLGCMACISACPSGVRYDRLITETRAEVEGEFRRPWPQRLLREAIFAVFTRPRRLAALRPALRAYQASGAARSVRHSGLLARLPATVQTMEAVLPPLGPPEPLPTLVPARGPRRGRVGLLTGCVQRVFFPQVNAATARVLAAEGFEVVIPRQQGCCGALSAHAGRLDEARRFARELIGAFAPSEVDAVIVNSAGCGSEVKAYAHLLADDAAYADRAAQLGERCVDVSEFLAAHPAAAPRHPLALEVAYHDACHLAHAQGVRQQPRQLLAAVPGLRLREIPEGEMCCGSAGVYNLLEPEAAAALGDRKAANVVAAAGDLLVAANPGCTLQISAALRRRGVELPVAHTVEVLDASIRGLSPDRLTCSGR